MEQRMRQPRGWHERFAGGLRINLESVPRLPAWAVRWALDDPRGRPYLFLWWKDSGEPEEAARVCRLEEPGIPEGQEWVSVTAPDQRDGFVRALRVVRRPLPRNGGDELLLICPGFRCDRPCRYLYAWEVSGSQVIRRPWGCRMCGQLCFSSEGGGLLIGARGAFARMLKQAFGDRDDRPAPWDPAVCLLLARRRGRGSEWQRKFGLDYRRVSDV